MDDAAAMVGSEGERDELDRAEAYLATHARTVICSSETLLHKMNTKTAPGVRTALVRNAMAGEWTLDTSPSEAPSGAILRLAYVGTVASWLDFAAMQKLLRTIRDLEIHLIGPVVDVTVPSHPRLVPRGPVEHEKLRDLMHSYDGFLLPFRIDSVTAAVDPVKLYEYLACGREVIAAWYPEISRFGPFVHFYRTFDELRSLVEGLVTGDLQPRSQGAREFLMVNTWDKRGAIARRLVSEASSEEAEFEDDGARRAHPQDG